MENNKMDPELVKSLSEIARYFENQRKTTKRLLIGIGVFFLLMVMIGAGFDYFVKNMMAKYESVPEKKTEWDWYHVSNAMEDGKLDEALEVAEYLIKKSPNYEYGYNKLGRVYNMRNELDKAKEAFKKAYELFPSESYKEDLEVIQRKIAKRKTS